MEMRKSLYKNTAFNVGYRALNVLFPLITSAYVSRIIGPTGVGMVASAQNILSYFLVVASVGIPAYGIKEIARHATSIKERSQSFFELFAINFIATTICIVGYILLVAGVPRFRSEWELYACVGVTLVLNYFNIDWFFAGLEEYSYIAIRSTIVKILAIVGLFIFVRSRDSIFEYAVISSLGISVNYILNIVCLRNKVNLEYFSTRIGRHLKPVLILLLTMFATDLYNQIDVTMMGGICSKAEIGHYSYAIRIVRVVAAVSTAVSVTMLPKMSVLFHEGKQEELNRFSNKVLQAITALMLPCATGVFLCSDEIVTIMFGPEFAKTGEFLKIFSPIIFIITISYLCGSVTLTAINGERFLLIATVAGALVNIFLNAVFIPRFWGQGAAVASVISEFIVLLLHYCFVRKKVWYRIVSVENLKCFVGTTFVVGTVILIQKLFNGPVVALLLSVIISAVIYFIVLLVLKHKVLLSIIRKARGYFFHINNS